MQQDFIADPHLSMEDYQLIFETLPQPYMVHLPDFPKLTIVAANDSYLALVSFHREEMIGFSPYETYFANPSIQGELEDVRLSVERAIEERVSDTGGILRLPYLKRDSGKDRGAGKDIGEDTYELRYVFGTHIPVLGEDGSVLFIILQVMDVTDFILKMNEKEQGNG